MFLKYLAKMNLILMLSKFSGQIGPKPNVLCSIQQIDRSGRVNRKRPYIPFEIKPLLEFECLIRQI